MSGKGDDPRPLSVAQDEFNRRWDAIDWNAREREQVNAMVKDLDDRAHAIRMKHLCGGQP